MKRKLDTSPLGIQMRVDLITTITLLNKIDFPKIQNHDILRQLSL